MTILSASLLSNPRPTDATLSVTKAAHVLGVHPNTIRAWSNAGRLRYYRINHRGDRRYRLGDLRRFLDNAAGEPVAGPHPPTGANSHRRASADRTRIIQPRRPVEGLGRAGFDVLTALGRIASSVIGAAIDPETLLGSAARAIREGVGLRQASIWRLDDALLVPVGVSGPPGARPMDRPRGQGILGAALGDPTGVVVESPDAPTAAGSVMPLHGLAAAIPGPDGPWGVLLMETDGEAPPTAELSDLVGAAAETIATIVGAAATAADVAHHLHRAEALQRVASDIGSRLDLDQILAGLVDHAAVLFGGDRAAVFLYQPDGSRRAAASRGLSPAYLAAIAAVAPASDRSLAGGAVTAGRPVFSVAFRDDPRAAEIRSAVLQEGFDTLCVAPLFDNPDRPPIGSLNIYHDRPHHWSRDEIETMRALATQASVAIEAARTYAQLATWAAQLQSIQQLGTRLSRLSSVQEVGATIAAELQQLIDYHNVRVYRVRGRDLVPVAMRGKVGEYDDETAEQLRVEVGSGITGWVAEHGVAQLLHDAAADPRAATVPGTAANLDESMLLAPMIHEDQVLGVLVLSKLGLRQFRDDDLRFAGDLCELCRAGDGERRRHRASDPPVGDAGAPAAKPAGPAPDHRVDPDHARRSVDPGRGRRSPWRPRRLGQRGDRAPR